MPLSELLYILTLTIALFLFTVIELSVILFVSPPFITILSVNNKLLEVSLTIISCVPTSKSFILNFPFSSVTVYLYILLYLFLYLHLFLDYSFVLYSFL